MKKYNLLTIITGILILLSVIAFTSAMSVSLPYMENKQLNLTLGETKDLQIVLQNGGAAEAINVKVTIKQGSEIIRLTDASDIYQITPGAQVPVNFVVTAPAGIDFGATYPIVLEFSEASANTETLSFGTGIQQSFTVLMAKTPAEIAKDEKAKQLKHNLILVGAILLVLIVLILIIIQVKKNKR
jgi:hypothetical protein